MWLCFGLLAYVGVLAPADALAINAVTSLQLEVHEWFWLGCGWVPFPRYYLIEMQNTIILLQSTMPLNLQLQ